MLAANPSAVGRNAGDAYDIIKTFARMSMQSADIRKVVFFIILLF
jgi:hypothetical protein